MNKIKALVKSKTFLAAVGALAVTLGVALEGGGLNVQALISEARAVFVAAAPVLTGPALPAHVAADAGAP